MARAPVSPHRHNVPVIDGRFVDAADVDAIDVDVVNAAVNAAVDAVCADPLVWFPIRHHSPTAAVHLRRALLERRPKVLFLEAPADAQHLVPHLLDKKTKPPVALYVSYRDDDNLTGLAGVMSPAKDIPPRFSAWFPLMHYSPEYVALQTCAEIGCDVVFFDLSRSALIEDHDTSEDDGDDGDDDDGDGDEVAARGAEEPPRGASWDQGAARSTFYRVLARTAGFKSFDACWDAYFEDPRKHAHWRSYQRDLAAFCAAVRATTSTTRMERDGTRARERFMWATLQQTLRERGVDAADAFVVCGGFHVFLDRNDTTPPPPVRAGTHYQTVAPYSSLRISDQTGYGAGNRAPAWYGRVYDAAVDAGGDVDDIGALLQHVVAVLSRGRKEEAEGLSSADGIAVVQQARMLAALRGRATANLDDVRDALLSCCCKGRPEEEGAPLLKAMAHAEIGTAIGRITPALGQLPLVHDFYACLSDLELGEVMAHEKRVEQTLDLRKDHDRRVSVFLHRLVHLGVPLAKATDERVNAATLFAERWALSFSPRVEEALIEKNLYGDTVEAAALAVLEEELAHDDHAAGSTARRLVRALHMDLPGLWARLEKACHTAVDKDARFVSLADAVVALQLLQRHLHLQGTNAAVIGAVSDDVLADLIAHAYGRACFLIPDVSDVGDDEQPAVVQGLLALAEVVQGTNPFGLDKALLVENLKSGHATSTTPFMRGALVGLLTETGAVAAKDLAAAVAAFAKAHGAAVLDAGPFLDGVMAVSRTSILLGADALVAAVDELFAVVDDDMFRQLIPTVRHAFERLHERQKDALAGHVAERYGLKDADDVRTLTTSHEALLELARVDAAVARVMEEWSL